MSRSMSANSRAIVYVLRVAAPQFYREVRPDANNEVERRGNALRQYKGTLSQSSTPSLTQRRGDPRDCSNRLLGSKRETQIQDRRGKTKRRSHHMQTRPTNKQSTCLRRVGIAARRK